MYKSVHTSSYLAAIRVITALEALGVLRKIETRIPHQGNLPSIQTGEYYSCRHFQIAGIPMRQEIIIITAELPNHSFVNSFLDSMLIIAE